MEIVFEAQYGINEQLLLSSSTLSDNYLFGLNLQAGDFRKLTDENIKFYIRAAQKSIEREFEMKFFYQIIQETRDFSNQEWKTFNYVRCTFPIVEVISVEGFLGKTRQVAYPSDWFTSKKSSENDAPFRNMYLIPGSSSAGTFSMIWNGISPMVGYFGNSSIPDYWHVAYKTGWKLNLIPPDIITLVGDLASIPLKMLIGNIVLGPGISSNSLSIDGLSQSLSSSPNAFASSIQTQLEMIKDKIDQLKGQYVGIRMSVC